MMKFSNSEMETFKRCRRKWWLAFYRRLRRRDLPVAGTPTTLGDRLHRCLLGYYENGVDPLITLTQLRDLALNEHPEQSEAIMKEDDMLRAMLEGYLDWLAETGADADLEVIGAETAVEYPLREAPGVVLVGKLDVRIRRVSDGKRFFMDHKSVGNFTDPLKGIQQDPQMLTYHVLEYLDYLRRQVADVEAERMEGGLYNMLRKVKRTARANPPFYHREPVYHNLTELRSHYVHIIGVLSEVLRLRRELDGGADPNLVMFPSPRGDCSWSCPFYQICPQFDDGSDVEFLVEQLYEEHDPYERYDGKEVTEGATS